MKIFHKDDEYKQNIYDKVYVAGAIIEEESAHRACN